MTVSMERRVDDAVRDGGLVVSHRADRSTWVPVTAAAVVVAALVAGGAATWDGGTASRVGPDAGQSSVSGPAVPIPHPEPQTPPRPVR